MRLAHSTLVLSCRELCLVNSCPSPGLHPPLSNGLRQMQPGLQGGDETRLESSLSFMKYLIVNVAHSGRFCGLKKWAQTATKMGVSSLALLERALYSAGGVK